MAVKVGGIVQLSGKDCEYLGKTEQGLIAVRRLLDGVIIVRPGHWFTKQEG